MNTPSRAFPSKHILSYTSSNRRYACLPSDLGYSWICDDMVEAFRDKCPALRSLLGQRLTSVWFVLQWFWASIQMDACADESMYTYRLCREVGSRFCDFQFLHGERVNLKQDKDQSANHLLKYTMSEIFAFPLPIARRNPDRIKRENHPEDAVWFKVAETKTPAGESGSAGVWGWGGYPYVQTALQWSRSYVLQRFILRCYRWYLWS